MQNKTAQPSKSIKKRDPGWVPVRRGLKEHFHSSRMSDAESSMFAWLLLDADWRDSQRGWVLKNYDDIARERGRNFKYIQRTLKTLSGKGYIEIEAAANQHDVTKIKILKFDRFDAESDSAVDTFVQSTNGPMDVAQDTDCPGHCCGQICPERCPQQARYQSEFKRLGGS